MFDTKVTYAHCTYRMWSGCSHVSHGCIHCHDERLAHRFKKSWGAEWGPGKPRKLLSEPYRKQPLVWNRRAEREGTLYRVLTLGGDLFDEEVPSRWKADFHSLILKTPNLCWLVLTKRIQAAKDVFYAWELANKHLGQPWPFPNVWLGLTVCNQQEADEKVPILLSIQAKRHWLSIEPMLGPLKIFDLDYLNTGGLDWVVAGCESGPGARVADIDWLRHLRDQCQAQGVPFYLKQMKINGKLVHDPELDGQRWQQIPE